MEFGNETDAVRRLQFRHRTVARTSAALVMATGCVVLLGWICGIEPILRFLPGYNPMRFNTALCMVASGGGVWLLAAGASKWRRRLARWLGIFVFTLALLTLAEYAFGWDLHLDQLMWTDAFSKSFPGRMVPLTAFFFVSAGTFLVLSTSRRPVLTSSGQIAAVIANLTAQGAVLDLIFRADKGTGVAGHTAAGVFLLSFGMLVVPNSAGVLRPLVSMTAGGRIIRRLVAASTLVPLATGWIYLEATRTGLLAWGTGIVIMVVLYSASLLMVTFWTAHSIDNVDLRLQRSEEETRFLAYHDALTGLANRAFVQERLREHLGVAGRLGRKAAILSLGLDGFKNINDSLGHSLGDVVLKVVAERLGKIARSQDIVARLGGDEFALVLSGINDSTDAAMAAERINAILGEEIPLEGGMQFVTCSVGISVFPEDGANAEALLKNADTALSFAKEKGRNRWEFFTKDMNDRALERLTLQNGLRVALAQCQFFLEYQPQVDVATGTVAGMEALLRWRHPDLGLVPPNRFIPVAESLGEIVPIGEWVLRTACAEAKRWEEQGLGSFRVGVNVSAVQFRDEPFLEMVKAVLEETGLAPEHLELELTESLLLTGKGEMTSVLDGLRELGVLLAIDDFGTGYSSFSYLRHYRFSKLKVDGSFIRGITKHADDAAIAAAIVSMGKILRMKVIAECVETEEQLKMLRTCGCDEIQGYLVSRPVGVSVLAEELRAGRFGMPGETISHRA